eukprot:5292754-Prymnesium_polylepis.1
MADFAMGIFFARVTQRQRAQPSTQATGPSGMCGGYGVRALVCDALLLGFVLSCVLIPISVDSPKGRTPDTARTAAGAGDWSLLFGIYLCYSSMAGGSSGLAASAASHPVMAALGEYAFAVYMLQFPVRRICQQFILEVNTSFGALAFLFNLVFFSILYTDKLEKPFTTYLIGLLR